MDKISRKIEQNECIYKASNDVVGIVFCVIQFLYMFTHNFYITKYMLRKKLQMPIHFVLGFVSN